MEKHIKQPSVGLEETEKKTIEYFLSHIEDFEQREDLMIESSNEIMRYCRFETNKLCVITGIIEDKPSFEIVLNEVASCQAKYDDDCLSNEEQYELW